mmetsp:Transcript_19958/g.29877  ORF Transcript_19958/g.29877 Transcript_19958/m.29877 type:complete len:446 (+) Transcript_19958:37-1374(+)
MDAEDDGKMAINAVNQDLIMTTSEHDIKGDQEMGSPLLYDAHGDPIKEPGTATLFSCIMNLSNTILGAGMLGLPHAFAVSGWSLGIFFLLFFASVGAFGLHLLATISVDHFSEKRDATFYSVAQKAFSKGALVIDVAVAIKCFGVATAYLIVIGDLLPQAFKDMGASGVITDRRLHITALMVCVIAPLCSLKKLDALRFTSTMSVGFVAFTVLVIFLFAVVPDLEPDDDDVGETKTTVFTRKTLKTLPIFIFGYTCHQNIFTVCNELNTLTHKRINTVIGSSISCGLSVYILIAVCGYLTFGDKVEADVLNGYPNHPLITITRVLISFLVTFSFPLQCFPCRFSAMQILTSAMGPSQTASAEVRRWWIITATICALSWFISMIVTDLGQILSVVGATGSTTISYILPGFVFFSLEKEWNLRKILALSLFILGCIIIPAALTFIFL